MQTNNVCVAILTNLPQSEMDFLKSKNCILPIYPGLDEYEGEKLEAILSMIEGRFKQCTIAIDNQNNSSKAADDWLDRNQNIINGKLKISHSVFKFDHWQNSPTFQDRVKKVHELYDTNLQYRESVDQVALESGKDLEYVLSESILELLWLNEKYDYIICTTERNAAVSNALTSIEMRRGKFFLRPVQIEFGISKEEERLELTTETLDQIINTSPGHIYWKDRNGVCLGCNLMQAQSFGFQDVASAIGKSDFDVLDHDAAMQVRKNDLEVMRSGKSCAIEEVCKFDGKLHTFLSHKTPLRNSRGEIVGVFGVSLDITEQKNILHSLDIVKSHKSYKASLLNLTEDERDFTKSKTCVVPISVGSSAHEGEKFRATLNTVNAHFKKCTIVVSDTLQRHTIAISRDDNKSADELYDLSKLLGDEWIARNEKVIKEELKIPYEIIRWDHWLESEQFAQNIIRVREAYVSNKQYKLSVDKAIDEFIDRYKKHQIDEGRISQNSLEYLFEESTCVLQWFDEHYDYMIYPNGKNNAVYTALKLFRPIQSKSLLHYVGIKFEERNSHETVSDFNQITLNNIIQTLPGNVYWKDRQGVALGCNLMQAKVMGVDNPESLLGKSEFDLVDYNQALEIRKNDLDVMRSGKLIVMEENVELSGKNFTFLSYKTPLMDEKKVVVGILGVSLDITKQKEAEKKLSEQNQALLKAIEAKREFLNNISHEIRTPLSCILKMSHLLYDDWEKYPNNEARKAHLKMAVDGSERLKNVLSNLLDLSKASDGKIEYDKKPYSLVKSVEDVISEFVDQKHRIHTKFDNGMDFELIYDHCKIEQVIRNLLANALTYGGSGDINITLSEKGGFVVFVITDRGVGVPEDELEEIFKIFTQSTRTGGSGGTGIGLSISKSIIEDHGGFIWAKNNKDGVGSHFSFKLPIESMICVTPPKPELIPSTPVYIAEPEDRPTLLVIDDDSSILEVSKLVFHKMGFNVITANSGAFGLERLRNEYDSIDVVLLDMMMPDLHGLEVLHVIAADDELKKMPIYIYSGISSREEINEALSLGALGFIDKTSSSDAIAKILTRFLS